MSLSVGQAQGTRRSSRRSVPTERAKDYIKQRESRHPEFPSENDEIKVKWILQKRVIWWPATVGSITSRQSNESEVRGMLLYHKLGEYEAEIATVIFSTSDSNSRFVRSVSDPNSSHSSHKAASWVFSDELQSDDYDDKDGESDNEEQAENNRSSSSLTTAVRGKGNDSLVGTPTTTNKFRWIPKNSSHSSRHIEEVVAERRGNSAISKERSKKRRTQRGRHSSSPLKKVVQATTSSSSSSLPEIDMRLRVIEQQLQVVSNVSLETPSPTMQSLIVSLRWALLRALERPLKNLNLPGLGKEGIASEEISIAVQCDYFTFREVARSLHKKHKGSSDHLNPSRVSFSPSYHTIQSGSIAADNMNIIFSCMPDLTSFLRIRDDTDYESVLSKEVVTETVTLLRILGTFTIGNEKGSQNSSTSNATPTNSVSASSDVTPVIRLFIGSSPVDYVNQNSSDVNNSGEQKGEQSQFVSAILKQYCKYFCQAQKCYRTTWDVENIRSTLSVKCPFFLDGTVPKEELKKFFRMTWTRQAAPSSKKWTRDIHDSGNNSPGLLRVTLPFIFFTSNRNVRSIASILDKHIETFMNLRLKMHCLSSFK